MCPNVMDARIVEIPSSSRFRLLLVAWIGCSNCVTVCNCAVRTYVRLDRVLSCERIIQRIGWVKSLVFSLLRARISIGRVIAK